MIKRINRTRLFWVGVPCIAAVCGFLVIYFPGTFTVSSGAEKRPSMLLYMLLPILFSSMFVTINTEFSLLGFRKNSILSVGFSLLFTLSVVIVLLSVLFNSFLAHLTTPEGRLHVVPFVVYGFVYPFFLFSIFALMILGFLRRKYFKRSIEEIAQKDVQIDDANKAVENQAE